MAIFNDIAIYGDMAILRVTTVTDYVYSFLSLWMHLKHGVLRLQSRFVPSTRNDQRSIATQRLILSTSASRLQSLFILCYIYQTQSMKELKHINKQLLVQVSNSPSKVLVGSIHSVPGGNFEAEEQQKQCILLLRLKMGCSSRHCPFVRGIHATLSKCCCQPTNTDPSCHLSRVEKSSLRSPKIFVHELLDSPEWTVRRLSRRRRGWRSILLLGCFSFLAARTRPDLAFPYGSKRINTCLIGGRVFKSCILLKFDVPEQQRVKQLQAITQADEESEIDLSMTWVGCILKLLFSK
uniref:Uncharacterized protein n=1 Tax=Strigamia maritima TaxID=126957 RepID=T1JC48_STRMM